jgi:hypothetical protein
MYGSCKSSINGGKHFVDSHMDVVLSDLARSDAGR